MKNSTSDHHPSKLACWWVLVNCPLVPFVVRTEGGREGGRDPSTVHAVHGATAGWRAQAGLACRCRCG